MATFEEQVEGLTQIDITTSSAPTQSELNQHIADAIVCTVNRVVNARPEEAMKFSTTSEVSGDYGADISGQVFSVVRGQSSISILKPATEIPAQFRYDVTDIDSLMYRSSYHPVFYKLDGKIYILPVPNSSSKGYITQLAYDISIDCTLDDSVDNFPSEYINIIILYTSALSCQSAASDLQNNLPDKPSVPSSPNFEADGVDLPSLPVYNPPRLVLDFVSIKRAIEKEDFDVAEKNSDLLSKQIEEYSKKHEQQNTYYQKEMDVFKSDLENTTKNEDREVQLMIGEYRSQIYKYQYDITEYANELQESYTKYKWFMEQYVFFMNEYNSALQLMLGRKEAPASAPPQRPKVPNIKEEAQQ